MPNVTISVPDQLKNEMDTYSDVNWSEVCRKAISRYIVERKNPTPNIELNLGEVRLELQTYRTGYPSLAIVLRILNKMDSDVTIDRILVEAGFINEDGRQFTVGMSYGLHRIVLGPTVVGNSQVLIPLLREKVEELQGMFSSTFLCYVRCTVFAEGFNNPYNQEVSTRIPIDDWRQLVKAALKIKTIG